MIAKVPPTEAENSSENNTEAFSGVISIAGVIGNRLRRSGVQADETSEKITEAERKAALDQLEREEQLRAQEAQQAQQNNPSFREWLMGLLDAKQEKGFLETLYEQMGELVGAMLEGLGHKVTPASEPPAQEKGAAREKPKAATPKKEPAMQMGADFYRAPAGCESWQGYVQARRGLAGVQAEILADFEPEQAQAGPRVTPHMAGSNVVSVDFTGGGRGR